MNKMKGIFISRIDKTVEPDPKKGYPVKVFRVWVNSAIPNTHRMLEGCRVW